MHHSFHKKILRITTFLNIDYNKIAWAPHQQIKMIWDGWCDTEDWTNDCWNFAIK